MISRAVNVGQTVAASLSAPTLFTIAGDLRQMEVHTSVAESDVGQLAQGMRAEFTVDAFPDDTFTGTVKQVRFEATTIQNVVTYDAVVDVRNDQLKLRPGMTANVTFVIAEAKDVITVAAKALRYRPSGAQAGEGSGAWSGSGSGSGNGRRRGSGNWDGSGSGTGNGSGNGNGSGSGDGSGNGSGNGNGSGSGHGSGGRIRGSGGGGGGGSGSGGGGGGGSGGGSGDDRARVATAPGVEGTARRKRPQAVWVLRNGTPVRIRVVTGLSDGTTTEIKDGLAEGDLVIVGDSSGKAAAGAGSARGNNPGGQRRAPRGVF